MSECPAGNVCGTRGCTCSDVNGSNTKRDLLAPGGPLKAACLELSHSTGLSPDVVRSPSSASRKARLVAFVCPVCRDALPETAKILRAATPKKVRASSALSQGADDVSEDEAQQDAATSGSKPTSYFSWALPRWIIVWCIIHVVILPMDMSFILMRPRSMEDLAHFWYAYKHYVNVDFVYRDMSNAFGVAQTYLNIPETLGYAVALYWAWKGRQSFRLFLMLFVTFVLTWWKTILYAFVEIANQFEGVKHNTIFDMVFVYFIPNGMWIVMPTLAIIYMGRRIIGAVEHSQVALASTKTE